MKILRKKIIKNKMPNIAAKKIDSARGITLTKATVISNVA